MKKQPKYRYITISIETKKLIDKLKEPNETDTDVLERIIDWYETTGKYLPDNPLKGKRKQK